MAEAINDFIVRASQGWMAAHSLINNPKALQKAGEIARQEPNPAKLMNSLTPIVSTN